MKTRFSLPVIGFITFFIIFYGFCSLLIKNLALYFQVLEGQIEIVAFLEDNYADGEQKDHILKQIETIPTVKRLKYMSKEAALAKFKQDPEFAKQIKLLEENPLPATIDIYLNTKSPRTINNIVSQIKTIEGVEYVDYTATETENLNSIEKIFFFTVKWFNITLGLFVVVNLILLSLVVSAQKLIFEILDLIIGSLFGFMGLYLFYDYILVANIKNLIFFSAPELVLMCIILIIIGIIVRIPKNVVER